VAGQVEAPGEILLYPSQAFPVRAQSGKATLVVTSRQELVIPQQGVVEEERVPQVVTLSVQLPVPEDQD
jgi:hypothetical protein